jgi:hypothetical protein
MDERDHLRTREGTYFFRRLAITERTQHGRARETNMVSQKVLDKVLVAVDGDWLQSAMVVTARGPDRHKGEQGSGRTCFREGLRNCSQPGNLHQNLALTGSGHTRQSQLRPLWSSCLASASVSDSTLVGLNRCPFLPIVRSSSDPEPNT